jgi:hypothetical protein
MAKAKKAAAKKAAKPAAKKAAKPTKAKTKTTAARTARAAPAAKTKAEPGWVDGGKGYQLTIRDGDIIARKDGTELQGIPKPIKDGDAIDQLEAACTFINDHAQNCIQTVEMWMLRSLPVPRKVLEAVLDDDYWRTALIDTWIVPVDKSLKADPASGGFLRAVDRSKGVGVVDRDGETTWIDTDTIIVPHPVLLDAVDDLRAMAVELGVKQGISQLYRETFVKPKVAPEDPTAISEFEGGEFAVLNTAIQLAKRMGYRVTGGQAVCRILERGKFVEGRYYLGDGDPMYETTTGELGWVDDKQKTINVLDVPSVSYSEGMRMASLIFAKRKIEKEGEDDDN